MAKRKRAGTFRFLVGFGLFVVAAVAAYWLSERYDPFRPTSPPRSGESSLKQDRDLKERRHRDILSRREALRERSAREAKPQKQSRSEPGRAKPPAAPRKKLAIIIDDLGQDREVIDELLKINQPITFAILPFCRYSVESAERAHRAGREVLLHLPMEPHGYPAVRPGEGALLSGMDLETLARELLRDLQAVPHAAGINNHMGSRLMEEEEKLAAVFRQVGEKDLFFIDSVTTGRSKGRQAARASGIRFAERDAFIDNGGDSEAAYRELAQAAAGEGNWQTKVLIGHPYPSTIKALKRISRRLPSEKVELVPVSRLATPK